MPLRLWVLYIVWFAVSVAIFIGSGVSLVFHLESVPTVLSLPASVVGIVGGLGLVWECLVGLRMDMNQFRARAHDA